MNIKKFTAECSTLNQHLFELLKEENAHEKIKQAFCTFYNAHSISRFISLDTTTAILGGDNITVFYTYDDSRRTINFYKKGAICVDGLLFEFGTEE